MRPDQDESKAIYRGAFFTIGQFRRGPDHSNFRGPHQIGGTLLVFPRTGVLITHAGKQSVVADPNTVMFYNDGQVYSRHKLSEKGDLCDWFGFDSRLVADAIRPFDAHVDDRPCHPFAHSHAPGSARTYLLQRTVFHALLSRKQPDALHLEETVLQILKQVIETGYQTRGITPQKFRRASERDVVDAVQNYLALHFEEQVSLEQVSTYVHYSPFHLCRIFRKHTGLSIHQCLNQLRLRASLEYLPQSNTDLTRLALQLGYANHSHFTEAFRKTFGITPSMLKNTPAGSIHQLLSNISIA